MLTDAQREVATRKLAEAKAAMAARAAGTMIEMQDEMQNPNPTLTPALTLGLTPTLTLTLTSTLTLTLALALARTRCSSCSPLSLVASCSRLRTWRVPYL